MNHTNIEYKIGDICHYINGVTFKETEGTSFYQAGYLPILRSGNIQDGELNTVDDLIWVPSHKISKEQLLQVGDIVMCMSSGSPQIVGKTAFVDKEFYGSMGAFCGIFRPINEEQRKYLSYWLRSDEFLKWRDSQARGINIQNLRPSQIVQIEIAFPPLPIQQRIATILEKAERLRHLRRYTRELSDTYLQSVFLEMFGDPVKNPLGWEVVTLKEIGKLDRGRSKHRPRNAPELYGGAYPFIQTGDVANATDYIRKFSQTYSDIGLKQSKLWPSGTMCITIAANIARTAVITFDACFPDSIVGFTPNERTNVEFIQNWFSFMQKNLEDIAPESAQKNINLEILKKLEVSLPPKSMQERFAKIVQEFERLRAQQRESEHQAEHLFQTLLHKAFQGELSL